MSDERKEKEHSKEDLLETIGSWRALLRKRGRWGDKPIIWPDEEIYQQLCQLIQQKPDPDDMKKYVEEKVLGFRRLNLDIMDNITHLESEHIKLMLGDFITQIISDVKGGK